MFQTILQRATVAFQKIKNFYIVLEVKSMSDFLKIVQKEKEPKVYIFLSWANYNKPDSEYRSCSIRFTLFLGDGRAVILKLQEEIMLVGLVARDRKKAKQYINARLLYESVRPPVQIMFALMPNAVIEVRDLF